MMVDTSPGVGHLNLNLNRMGDGVGVDLVNSGNVMERSESAWRELMTELGVPGGL